MTEETNKNGKEFFLVPHGYRVIALEDEFKYQGRLVIPDTAKQRPTTGVIIAISPEHKKELAYLEGKHVVYARFSGTLLTFKDKPAYRVLSPEEIQAFIESEEGLVLEDTSA